MDKFTEEQVDACFKEYWKEGKSFRDALNHGLKMIFPFATLTVLAFFTTLAIDKTVYGQRKK